MFQKDRKKEWKKKEHWRERLKAWQRWDLLPQFLSQYWYYKSDWWVHLRLSTKKLCFSLFWVCVCYYVISDQLSATLCSGKKTSHWKLYRKRDWLFIQRELEWRASVRKHFFLCYGFGGCLLLPNVTKPCQPCAGLSLFSSHACCLLLNF